jgi:hypothetical protein
MIPGMTADERVASILQKVTRAKQHADDLLVKVKAFLNTRPYAVDTKRDSATRRLIYYVASVRDTPTELALISGDVLHNLRSALDHLAYQLFLVGTGGASPGFRVYFPIGDDLAEYQKKQPKMHSMRK